MCLAQFIGIDLRSNKKPASLSNDPWEGKQPFTERQWADTLKNGKSPEDWELDLNKLFFKRHSFIEEQWPGDSHSKGNILMHGQQNQLNMLDAKAQKTQHDLEKTEHPSEGDPVSQVLRPGGAVKPSLVPYFPAVPLT